MIIPIIICIYRGHTHRPSVVFNRSKETEHVIAGDGKLANYGRNTILCERKTGLVDTKNIVYSRALPPIYHWRRHSAGGGKARLTARACACSFAQMTVAAAAFPGETKVVVICPERLPARPKTT